MLRALRLVSVERGHDPRDFALVAFGGAGPLHACALAEELGIATVLVPAAAGVLSALGLVVGDERRDRVRSYVCPLDEAGELPAEGEADLRYRGPVVRADRAARAATSRPRSTARTRSATATPIASRAIELVAVRTADVRPGARRCSSRRREPLRGRRPRRARARRRHLLDPPGVGGG